MARTRKLKVTASPRNRSPRVLFVLVSIVIALLVLSPMLAVLSSPTYGYEMKWSCKTLKVGGIHVGVRWTSDVHVFGAVNDQPVLVPFKVISDGRNPKTFLVEGISPRGVTPRDGAAILVDDGVPPSGFVVGKASAAIWSATIVPHFPSQPPLQFQLSIDCSVDGKKFQLGANAIFRTSGEAEAQPIHLERVPSQDQPDLTEDAWGGVTYYYSILASYPSGAGLSLYRANLVMVFEGNMPIPADGMVVTIVNQGGAVIPLTVHGNVAEGTVSMCNGELIEPGYTELFELSLTFSLFFPARTVTYQYSAMSV